MAINGNFAIAGLLRPLLIPIKVWKDVSLDFVDGLRRSNEFITMLVVVDRLTKYSQFLGLSRPFSVVTVANLFIKEIVRLHEFLSTIISDRYRIFMSLMEIMVQITGHLTVEYHCLSSQLDSQMAKLRLKIKLWKVIFGVL